ncbi:MAG TPA: hypothetical protein VHW23_41040 [Kofleriaceae bacterium]|jgi:hypothetical protein|nr:hypothetical protein [Kofleriaceae bacterium]
MPRRSLSFASLLAAALTAGACDDVSLPSNVNPPPGGGSGADAGSGGGGGSDVGAAKPTPPVGLVVVNSDFMSTSISLLDGSTGQVTKGDCIDSGTRPPGSTPALSSDVVVPSAPQPGNPVLLIDRKNAALTWLDPATCMPTHQLDVSTGFAANPHDVIGLSTTKAYVMRYDPSPNDAGAGDDILIIDPSVPAITGRIDLSSFVVPVSGAVMKARPDHARLINGNVFVSLNELSDDFFSGVGHGRVIEIDPATDQVVATIDIPELADCVEMSYVEASQTLVVVCTGDFTAADPTLTSGIAYIDVSASPPVEVLHQTAAAFAGRALSSYSGIAQNGALGFAVTPGVFGTTPHDRLWSFNVASGQATPVTDASDSFVYGTVLVDPDHLRVYLTDGFASTPRVQIYDYTSGTAVHQAAIEADAASGLPPREIARY